MERPARSAADDGQIRPDDEGGQWKKEVGSKWVLEASGRGR